MHQFQAPRISPNFPCRALQEQKPGRCLCDLNVVMPGLPKKSLVVPLQHVPCCLPGHACFTFHAAHHAAQAIFACGCSSAYPAPIASPTKYHQPTLKYWLTSTSNSMMREHDLSKVKHLSSPSRGMLPCLLRVERKLAARSTTPGRYARVASLENPCRLQLSQEPGQVCLITQRQFKRHWHHVECACSLLC